MHFAAIFAAVSLAVSSVTASPLNPRDVDANVDALSFDVTVDADVQRVVGFDLSASNFYGAPYPPWVPESFPGWYVGDHSADFPELPCLVGVSLESHCFAFLLTLAAQAHLQAIGIAPVHLASLPHDAADPPTL